MNELDVASDDSQTFVRFRMRTAAREQVRVRNEREEKTSQRGKASLRSKKPAHGFIDVEAEDDEDQENDHDSAKVITSTSLMSQSVQISRRKHHSLPGFEVDESWPYHLMNHGPLLDKEYVVAEDDENVELLETLDAKKVDLPEGGSKSVIVDSYGREIREPLSIGSVKDMVDLKPLLAHYERTLLDLLRKYHLFIRCRAITLNI